MRWMQALVFCGGLIYAVVDDLKTRTVSDIVCIVIALVQRIREIKGGEEDEAVHY